MKKLFPIFAMVLCLSLFFAGCGDVKLKDYWYPVYETISDAKHDCQALFSLSENVSFNHEGFQNAVNDEESEFNQLVKYYESFIDYATFGITSYQSIFNSVPVGEDDATIMQHEKLFTSFKTKLEVFSGKINELYAKKKKTEEFFASTNTFSPSNAIEKEKLRQLKVAFADCFDSAVDVNSTFLSVYQQAYTKVDVDIKNISLTGNYLKNLISLSLELQNALLTDVRIIYFDENGILHNNNGSVELNQLFDALKKSCVIINEQTMKTKIAPIVLEEGDDGSEYVDNDTFVASVKYYFLARNAFLNEKQLVNIFLENEKFDWAKDFSKIVDEIKREVMKQKYNNVFEHINNSTIVVDRFSAILELFV